MVNVEFPVRPMDFMGGHHVLGHIDTNGKVVSVDKTEAFWFVDIEVPEQFSHYVVYKGSIAVNGVSLTVNNVKNLTINLCLIPITLEKSSLGQLKPGGIVNLEFDILAKYTERFLIKKFPEDV
jgi:riboflavin synthase